MDIERAKATIRQLLNLANDDAAAKGEIENAMRFAAKLMEQHQLSDEDLSEVDDILLNLERAEMKCEAAHAESTKMTFWEGQAAMFACQLVGGVKCYRERAKTVRNSVGIVQLDPKTGRVLQRPSLVFYGVAEDVELARQVYSELVVTIAAMARLKYGGVFQGDGRQYCEGFTAGLHSQLKNDSAQALLAARTTGGNALVAVQGRAAIVERKESLADKFITKELGVKIGGGGTSYRSNGGSAYGDGRSDGSRHNASAERRKKIGC